MKPMNVSMLRDIEIALLAAQKALAEYGWQGVDVPDEDDPNVVICRVTLTDIVNAQVLVSAHLLSALIAVETAQRRPNRQRGPRSGKRR